MKLVNIEGPSSLIGKIVHVEITDTKSFSLDGKMSTFGRNPADFFEMLASLDLKHELYIYVQWLGYEFLNCRGFFEKYFPDYQPIFRHHVDKPIIIRTGKHITFRDSAMLSNKSLEKMGQEIGFPLRFLCR